MHFHFQAHLPDGASQDLDWCERHPLGGTETAVLRMAAALRRQGHEVTISGEPASCEVFVAVRDFRLFAQGRGPGRLNYLWCHDDVNQPFVEPLRDRALAATVYGRCDRVIVLSHYMLERWQAELHLSLDKVFLSSNGVPLERFRTTPETLRGRPPRAYYSSTPFRGLELLLKAWPIVHDALPQAELWIFSSMQIYRTEDSDEQRQLYEQARTLPGVRYQGAVGQAELREATQQCRVLAYPCVFPETSCITAMEAMASGCAVVSTALGALPETAWRNPLVPLGDGWINVWALELFRLLVDEVHYLQLAEQNLAVARWLGWETVAKRWIGRIEADLAVRGGAS